MSKLKTLVRRHGYRDISDTLKYRMCLVHWARCIKNDAAMELVNYQFVNWLDKDCTLWLVILNRSEGSLNVGDT